MRTHCSAKIENKLNENVHGYSAQHFAQNTKFAESNATVT